MPLAEAAALVNAGHIAPADEIADLAALAKLAEHCERFSPLVGWETIQGSAVTPTHLFLEVTTIDILFGGARKLIDAVTSELAGLGYHAHGAIANTIGTAWAKAIYQEPFPIAALRVPDETTSLLAQLGITQIEQLVRLPRASLAARFGEQLGLRLDQFHGVASETIVAYRPLPAFQVDRQLEYPAERHELVEQIVRELTQQLAAALIDKQQGALQLICRMDGRPPRVLPVELYRPSADAAHLWDLLRVPLEQPLQSPVSRITLTAPRTASLQRRQQELFGGGSQEAGREFAFLVDRLSSRLGPQAVLRPEWTADPLPERAITYVPLVTAERRKRLRTRIASPTSFWRPLVLRSPPLALEVVSLGVNGPPLSFSLEGQQHAVARWWGPERIESGWWRGPHARRDYYRVESASGVRFWLFCRLQDGQWFFQGEFI